jgi:phage antirepressor YoqD-like protein
MKVYSAKDTAAMLQICTETLRRIVRNDGIQHRRIGRRILFTEADIAAILESRAMTGAVNPYQRKQKQQTENTTNEQPSSHTDGSSTVPASTASPDSSQS